MNKTIRSTWVDSSIQELDGSDNKFKTQAVWRASIDTDESTTNYKSIDQASGDANIAQDYNSITNSSKGWQSFIGPQIRTSGKITAAHFHSSKGSELRSSEVCDGQETESFPLTHRKTALNKTNLGMSKAVRPFRYKQQRSPTNQLKIFAEELA